MDAPYNKKDETCSRRRFVRNAAVAMGAAGPAGARSAWAAALKETSPAVHMSGVELAVATICADGFANHRHEPTFRMIPQTGISAVEFNIWYPELLSPAYAESILRRCSQTGLKPISVQGSSFGGEGKNPVVNDVGDKLWLMVYARRLGCRRVKRTGAGRGTNGGLENVIRGLPRIGAHGGGVGRARSAGEPRQ